MVQVRRNLTTLNYLFDILTFAPIGSSALWPDTSPLYVAVKGFRDNFLFTRKSRVKPRAKPSAGKSRITEEMDNNKNSHDVQDDSKESAFYVDAAKYWEQVPPTGIHWFLLLSVLNQQYSVSFFLLVDGMLGGLSSISDIDLKGSQRFLNSIFQVCLMLCTFWKLKAFKELFTAYFMSRKRKSLRWRGRHRKNY